MAEFENKIKDAFKAGMNPIKLGGLCKAFPDSTRQFMGCLPTAMLGYRKAFLRRRDAFECP